jgi:glyoxylase-like metal-dependent hydrolase (beta-lactamase superfamily II)
MGTEKITDPAAENQPAGKIAPGIYQIQIPLATSLIADLSPMNAYLIEGRSGWVLIDTGWNTPIAQRALDSAFESLGLTFKDISSIIITHSHPDHMGQAGRIKQLSPKTQIMMHHLESALMKSRYINSRESDEKMSALLREHGLPEGDFELSGSFAMPALEFVNSAPPDEVFYGGEILPAGLYNTEVIWTPGHSSGHICLYEPENRILFSGDHILPSITPNISYYTGSGDNPLGDYHCSLNKLINLPVTLVCPGHENSFADLKSRIEAILEHHRQRESEIQKAIDGQSRSAYQIARLISWNLPGQKWEQFPPMQKRLAITETISHLEHLRWQGKLRKFTRNNQFFYSLG